MNLNNIAMKQLLFGGLMIHRLSYGKKSKTTIKRHGLTSVSEPTNVMYLNYDLWNEISRDYTA